MDVPGLVATALGLGAGQVAGLSAAERALPPAGRAPVAGVRERIEAGEDPLGEALAAIRGINERRRLGQTLTPLPIVESMIRWAAAQAGPGGPCRVIDPGTGSARFLLAAGRRWPGAQLIGVETDPVAALIARANLAAAGLAARARVILADYRSSRVPAVAGRTVYLGNPPYVRHHQIAREWKDWLAANAARRGLAASRLAGLHVHFFLATALHAAAGDIGVFITAAEWLDVNYGSLIRALLLGDLGGQSVHVLEPSVAAFPDVTVTSAITCFLPGSQPAAMLLRRAASIASLGDLRGGSPVPRAALGTARAWGALANGSAPGAADDRPVTPGQATASPAARRDGAGRRGAGQVELGEICRVHRGQVTGANAVWVRRRDETDMPGRFCFPAVTRARELFQAGGVLSDAGSLRVVIDLPADFDDLDGEERELVGAFLAGAVRAGAAGSYIARHRRRWWRVGLAEPAPILATYMARRPPAFVRNLAGVRHLNIAHGLYPREPWPAPVLDRLAAYLSDSVTLGQGRTYAGGLTKFEPGEMERLPIPWEQVRSSC